MNAFANFNQLMNAAQDAGARARYSGDKSSFNVTLSEADANKLGIGQKMALKISKTSAHLTFFDEGEVKTAILHLPSAHAKAFKHSVAQKNAADAALIVWVDTVCLARGWPSAYSIIFG